MSVKPDERVLLKRRDYDLENAEANLNMSKEKADYCNMNIATFTFGGRGGPNLQMNSLESTMRPESNAHREGAINSNNYRKYNSMKKFPNPVESEFSTRADREMKEMKAVREDYPKESQTIIQPCNQPSSSNPLNKVNTESSFALSCIINKIGSHNSFLSVVIHTFWNLKFYRNYILSEITLSEKDTKNKLILELQSVLVKYSQNKKIDISKLRSTLADLFQNRRKFLLDQPDDPIDCYFAFLNAKNSLNEVIDTMCNTKCICHKYFWIDLCRIDECECKGSSKRYFSNHNYIFDIPLDKLFELSNNINLIEMSKSFKLKSGKFSEVGSTEMLSISDLKGKLFLYFKMLLNQVKVDCPAKGVRCEVNKTNKNFYLNNFPNYLSFSLQKTNLENKLDKNLNGQKNNFAQNTVIETLKTFVMIPKIFDLGTLFEHSSKQKIFFEFFGAILLKPSKNYSCFFKNQTQNSNSNSSNNDLWIHYDDEKITTFASQFELISFCLKNCEFPLLLFYQIQEKYSDNEKDLSLEELQILERYARNADNLVNIVCNRFRSNEEIIKFENVLPVPMTRNNLDQNSSKNTSISTSKPSSTNNSNSRIDQITEYSCISCYSKNRIECLICVKCNKNNEAVIEELLKKRGMSYINIANFNLNINTAGIEVNKEKIDRERDKVKDPIVKDKEKDREKERDSKTSSTKKASCPFSGNDRDKKLNNYIDEEESDIEEKENYNNRNNKKKSNNSIY